MNNLITIIIFITALVFFVQLIQAQSADEIISKYNSAMGGVDAINLIKSFHATGTHDNNGQILNIEVIKVQGALSRIDFHDMSSKGFVIITPQAGWSYIPLLSPYIKIFDERLLSTLQNELDIHGLLVDYISKNNKVHLVGKEEINNKDVFRIQITTPSNKIYFYLIDRHTYLLNQIEIPTKNSNRHIIELSNYKEVEGVLFPFSISNSGNNIMNGITTYTSIKLNQPVPDEMYIPTQ